MSNIAIDDTKSLNFNASTNPFASVSSVEKRDTISAPIFNFNASNFLNFGVGASIDLGTSYLQYPIFFPSWQFPVLPQFPLFQYNSPVNELYSFTKPVDYSQIFNLELPKFEMPTFNNFQQGAISTPQVKANYSDNDTTVISYDSETLFNKWGKKNEHITQSFCNKVVEISKRLKCDPNDLMCVMNSESGIKPTSINKSSGATGLIQFMPRTAESLGTSCEALASMTAEEQLVYVEKFLTNAKKRAGLSEQQLGAGTLYTLIFLPAYANRDVLCDSSSKYYRPNKGLDRDEDGLITKADLAQRVHEKDIA